MHENHDGSARARVFGPLPVGTSAVLAEDYASLAGWEALGLVPRPLYSWAVTTWILTAMAEAYHLMKDHARVKETLMETFRCEGAIGTPFLHLRLGQAEIALGQKGRGVEELIRAHERGGDAVFEGEDPRYLALVRSALDAG